MNALVEWRSENPEGEQSIWIISRRTPEWVRTALLEYEYSPAKTVKVTFEDKSALEWRIRCV